MAIESICKSCGQRLSVADEHAGKQARCPACGDIYTILVPSADMDADNQFGLAATSYAAESAQETGFEAADQYWMRAADGTEYGPVDRQKLHRWFEEGRVAENYQIRQGAVGAWMSPAAFRNPTATASNSNPYASTSQPRMGAASQVRHYPKPDQSGLILAMGILSFFVCGIFGVIAWVMGNTALKDIQAGQVDPTNRGLTQVGYYLGMVNVILHLLCFGGSIVVIAIGAAG